MSDLNSSGMLGTIKWNIIEVPPRRTIYRGSRDIVRNDIEVVEIPPLGDQIWSLMTSPKPRILSALDTVVERVTGGGKQYSKRIRLEGGFWFELNDRPVRQREDLLGFGLAAQHEWAPTFSGEWFAIDARREHAAKIQEGGRLKIGVERGRSGWEVGYTEFLTGVSLRMKPIKDTRFGGKRIAREPRWRVWIAKGSCITWPSADEIERWEA